jgi:putative SOS response-associated peptidase YedK
MIVVLREEDEDAWLDATPDGSMQFMRQCPPEQLVKRAATIAALASLREVF